ncbi:NAD(P)H-quinone oxidoreductase [Microbaculum marinum]|uniref:NAD(P)H-quinone oxidoreductase n=1 Tax=Microbaculum marinum TaxID=1764581 RepID=A0AAW9RZ84_9HYPH
MKAVTAPPFGGPEVLSLTDMPRPSPAPDQLLVRVGAIGVNRVDAMQRSGIYAPPPGAGDILGVEFAGEVAEVGADAGDFKPGDRVFGLVAAGAYAEYAVIHHRHAVRTPDGWTDVKAAAVAETFCTAHETLFELGGLSAGERILIHAVGSAVGTSALQMAVSRGATVVGTAGSEQKITAAKALGAENVINYKAVDFADELLRLYPDGVDQVEDFIGSPYFQRHLKVLKLKGRIVQVGVLGAGVADIDTGPILYKRLTVRGFTLRPQNDDEKAGITDRFVANWLPRLVDGSVDQVMHAVLPFDDVREAHRILEDNENFGKVVMTVS